MQRCIPRTHIEPAHGSEKENIHYCFKEGDVVVEQSERNSSSTNILMSLALLRQGMLSLLQESRKR